MRFLSVQILRQIPTSIFFFESIFPDPHSVNAAWIQNTILHIYDIIFCPPFAFETLTLCSMQILFGNLFSRKRRPFIHNDLTAACPLYGFFSPVYFGARKNDSWYERTRLITARSILAIVPEWNAGIVWVRVFFESPCRFR